MRTLLNELSVVAASTWLPAAGESARITLGHSGPRGRGDAIDLPAFDADPRLHAGVPRSLRKRIDRFSAVAHLAVAQTLSAIPEDQRPERDRIGVFLANTRAGWAYGEPELERLVRDGAAAMHAYQATAWFPAAAQGEVTIDLDLRGCAKTTAGRESGFGEALWLARDALERGVLDLAVVGAAESLVNGFVLRDWPDDEPLPAQGPAEGAVVFALGRVTDKSAAVLSDLRHSGRAERPDADWVPTLSAAIRLHEAVTTADTESTVAIGGSYWITVTPAKENL